MSPGWGKELAIHFHDFGCLCRVSSQQCCLPCRLWQELDPRRVALSCVHFPEQRTLAADEALDPAPASSAGLAHWLAEQLSLLDTGTSVGRSKGAQAAPAIAAAAPRFHSQGMDPAWLLLSVVQVGPCRAAAVNREPVV